ncbi:hypothetical protein ABZ915_02365 [Streptomyces sp. NPDC046915]|uniref:hypothetical protein n=1 Tax=Streptomyces sp. NPDC046915 TaxID=3155257 RepID=UPI0033EB7247
MEYTVVTLGPSGAGKTVYLAVLWQVLRLQHHRLGCYLTLDDVELEQRLNRAYREVAGPGEWPLSTDGSEFPEWTFSVRVRSQHGQFTAMRVRYLDYAGDRLTDPQEGSPAQRRLDATMRDADALLGLLDGRKVLRMMQGDAGFLDEDMSRVFGLMQGCNGPIHFVITKWDLLAGHYSLKRVRERLMEHPDFHTLATSRQSWQTAGMPVPPGRVRLIPVSSVGNSFAFLGADGAMHKKANARPDPLNVDVAFAAVLPDLLANAVSVLKAEAEAERRIARGEQDNMVPQFVRTVASALAAPAQSLLATRGVQLPVQTLAAFMAATAGAAAGLIRLPPSELRKARRLQKTFRRRSVNAVRDEASAAQFVTHRLVEVLTEFERSPENDGSNLS